MELNMRRESGEVSFLPSFLGQYISLGLFVPVCDTVPRSLSLFKTGSSKSTVNGFLKCYKPGVFAAVVLTPPITEIDQFTDAFLF